MYIFALNVARKILRNVWIVLLGSRLHQASASKQSRPWNNTSDIGFMATHSGVTPLFSMSAILLASSQGWICIDANAWCELALNKCFTALDKLCVRFSQSDVLDQRHAPLLRLIHTELWRDWEYEHERIRESELGLAPMAYQAIFVPFPSSVESTLYSYLNVYVARPGSTPNFVWIMVCSHPTRTIPRPRLTMIIMGSTVICRALYTAPRPCYWCYWLLFSHFIGLATYIVLGVAQREHTINHYIYICSLLPKSKFIVFIFTKWCSLSDTCTVVIHVIYCNTVECLVWVESFACSGVVNRCC